MAIQILPTVATEPTRSQTGGLNGRVEPMRDATAGSLLAVGGGLQDLGRATTIAADRFQDQVDVAQSQRMRNLYDVEVENELQAPDTGFLTTSGMDANKDRRKQSFDRLKEKRQSIEALGQNDVQRVNFAEHADRSDAESRLRADIHQEREVKHFLAGEKKVSAELGIKRGIQLVGTDEGDIAVAGAMRDIDQLADLYGWPKDSKLRADAKQDAMDALHSGVIDQFTQDPQAAPQAAVYLAEHRKEMSPNTLSKAVDDVRRAMKIGQQQHIDAAAWTAANKYADSGASLTAQRAAIDQSVRTGLMSPEVAKKTWDLAQDFNNQKWQDLQRERASTKDQIEQDFAKNQDLSAEKFLMDAELADKIDRLGLRSDVFRLHNEVRLKRLVDQIGEGSLDSLVLSRDMRSITDMQKAIGFLNAAADSISGDQLKIPEKKAAKDRLLATAQKAQDDIVELLMRPRTPVMHDDLTPPMPNKAPAQTPAEAQKQNEMKKQQLIKSLREALYPGSGR